MAKAPAQKRRTGGQFLHRAFQWGVILKAFDGALEILGGCLLLIVTPAAIHRWAILLTQAELLEDPTDWVANSLLHLGGKLSPKEELFGAVYLLIHGLVKIGLVTALLKKRLWAYPTALGILATFIVYQAYLLVVGFTAGLLLLTALDSIILALIWREYRCTRGPRQGPRPGRDKN